MSLRTGALTDATRSVSPLKVASFTPTARVDEPFEVGAFTVDPGQKGYGRDSILSIQRRPVRSGQQTVSLVLDQVPKFVGVGPFNERIDRNSEDTLTSVKLE
jgi:ABC-2 type transport system permease protein